MMSWRANLRAWGRLRGDTRGVAAVEFALVIPMVIIVYAGGFEIAQAATVNRKVTDTTVQLANVTSQYTTVAHPDVNTIFGAASEIMEPYSPTPLTIVLSEVQADSAGSTSAKVIWTQSYANGTPGACATSGPNVTMPTGLPSPNQYYILVQTTYLYTPTIGSAFVSNIPIKDQVFMIRKEVALHPLPDLLRYAMTDLFRRSKRDGSKGWRLWNNRRGNVALITAFMLIPLTVALGTAYDFTMAESRQDQIDGMADIATLGGVTPQMMGLSNTAAQAYSKNLFTSQLATVNGVTYNLSDIDTTGSGDSSTGATVVRTIVINYKAASTNVFASLVNMPTFPLKGSSTATSSAAPNIDFYLMLDTSPSMEIAATSTGIATMIANTQQESDPTGDADIWPYGPPPPVGTSNNPGTFDPTGGKFAASPNGNGCAFGCHESSPDQGTYLNQAGKAIPCTVNGNYADGTAFTTASTFPKTGRDNYDLSRCLGVTLRSDLVNQAAQNLMTVAATTEVNNLAKYRMALFETANNSEANPLNLYTLQTITSDLNLAKTQAATVQAARDVHQQ